MVSVANRHSTAYRNTQPEITFDLQTLGAFVLSVVVGVGEAYRQVVACRRHSSPSKRKRDKT